MSHENVKTMLNNSTFNRNRVAYLTETEILWPKAQLTSNWGKKTTYVLERRGRDFVIFFHFLGKFKGTFFPSLPRFLLQWSNDNCSRNCNSLFCMRIHRSGLNWGLTLIYQVSSFHPKTQECFIVKAFFA